MAAVTFTRKAASELRGRFHLALEAAAERQPRLPGAARGGARRPPRALEPRALLRRHHPLVLRAAAARAAGRIRRVARLHRARRGAGPRAAPPRLARLHRPARAAPAIPTCSRCSRPDVKPKDLDTPSPTSVCNEDVEFPPGDAQAAGPGAGGCAALEAFWADAAEARCRRRSTATRPARSSKRRRDFGGQLRVARGSGMDRPAASPQLLETWDCESKIIQKWWARHGRREDGSRRRSRRCTRDFRAGVGRAVSRAVAAVCLPAVGQAADHARAATRPASAAAATR